MSCTMCWSLKEDCSVVTIDAVVPFLYSFLLALAYLRPTLVPVKRSPKRSSEGYGSIADGILSEALGCNKTGRLSGLMVGGASKSGLGDTEEVDGYERICDENHHEVTRKKGKG
ncbi:unnamed protein product, partial [Choristocarpus tenellus]